MTALKQTQLDALILKMKQDYKTLLIEVREELEQSGEQHRIDLLNREPGDSGDESFANALADAQLDRHVDTVRDIEAAMMRVKNSEYGACVDCGDDINFERLQAYPTAKRCIKCQTKREQLYEPQGLPSL